MCNLYIMYYTDAKDGTAYHTCTDMCNVADFFPEDSDVPLPPNPLLEEHALHGGHVQNETININNKMSINLVSFLFIISEQCFFFVHICYLKYIGKASIQQRVWYRRQSVGTETGANTKKSRKSEG